MEGSTPHKAPPIHSAIGHSPNSFTLDSLANMTDAAPSLIPDAFPAVTTPPSLNAGFSLDRASAVVPSLGASSVSTMISHFFCFTMTGTISGMKIPLLTALQAFC